MQSKFFQPGWIILSLLIAVIVVIAAFFLFSQPNTPQTNMNPVSNFTPSSSLVPTSVNITEPNQLHSPLSPISPISSVQGLQPLSGQPLNPETLELMIQESIQHFENREYEKAIEKLNQVIDQNPNAILAYNVRGSVYQELGKPEQALSNYTKAIEIEPRFPHAYFNRGRLYFSLKQFNEALADMQKAIELAPDEFGYRANGNIGLIYHQMGDYEKALDAFNKSISYNKDNRADVYYLRAETYTALEDYASAIADYQAAIQRFATYGQAYQGLGYAQYQLGQYDQALDSLERANDLSPDNARIHFLLGLVHVALNNVDQAEAEIDQAIGLSNNLPLEEQTTIYQDIRAELETFSSNNPDKQSNMQTLMDMIPGEQ